MTAIGQNPQKVVFWPITDILIENREILTREVRSPQMY